jgi:hypothetical protein
MGLVLVIVLLGGVLSVFAGSHVDPRTGLTINNFLNSHTLIQTATDASFFAIRSEDGNRGDGRAREADGKQGLDRDSRGKPERTQPA